MAVPALRLYCLLCSSSVVFGTAMFTNLLPITCLVCFIVNRTFGKFIKYNKYFWINALLATYIIGKNTENTIRWNYHYKYLLVFKILHLHIDASSHLKVRTTKDKPCTTTFIAIVRQSAMHHWMWYELKKVEVLQNALKVIISFWMPAHLIYAHNCDGCNRMKSTTWI